MSDIDRGLQTPLGGSSAAHLANHRAEGDERIDRGAAAGLGHLGDAALLRAAAAERLRSKGPVELSDLRADVGAAPGRPEAIGFAARALERGNQESFHE